MSAIQKLIGRQRAEFDLASKYFHWKFVVQLALFAIGAFSIVVEGKVALYWMALAALVILLLWLFLELRYRKIRSCAERARRATLIMGGLGKPISSYELNDIRECMSSSERAGAKNEDPGYFASDEATGPTRLAEMLEESAYWTLNLQRISAAVMWVIFAAVLATSVLGLIFMIPETPNSQLMVAARVVCAIITFAVGTDMFGAARAYSDTVKTLERLILRFDSARARGFQEPDLLLMLSDYNAAVENTPLSLPFIYALEKDRLTKNWNQRLQDRQEAASHGG